VSGSNRNIVFDVSGYIVLKTAVSLSSSITINGQTAPSPGIGIMAGEVSANDKSNIIIRSMCSPLVAPGNNAVQAADWICGLANATGQFRS
jgi:hypothetical protein